MKTFKRALAALLLVSLLVLVFQNLMLTELHFVVWTISLPVAIPVAFAYLLGGLTAHRLFRFFIAEKREIQRDRRIRREVADRISTDGPA